jgi:hypothetical protein
MSPWPDIELELAQIERQLIQRVREKIAAEQKGEAFRDLPTAPPLVPEDKPDGN